MERKLAAILAADVVGYSALMEQDEQGTFERLKAGRKELFEPEIARHHGHTFKLMGDGLLAEFSSVVDAVECAVSLQHALAERNAAVSEDHRIRVRIGINLGEVIVEGEDRYGEGVNVAARLQQLAEPGGICVSAKVAKEVEKKLAFGFEPMGQQKLKNIAEPVQAYRVLVDPAVAGKPMAVNRHPRFRRNLAVAIGVLVIAVGLAAAWWRPWESPPRPTALTANAKADPRPSLVVLPFDNLSDDKAQGYLADGFTEDLTTELARVPGLFVISRNAASTYKDTETKPAEVAAALGVRYILEGSIRRVGDDMRINAQLIDGSTTGHLWAERFDGQWTDVFALQDKVVVSIAGALKLRLVSAQGKADVAGGTRNPAAYEAYLQGLEIYNRRNTPDEFAQAVRFLQQALELDPNFGAAAASLAWAYWEMDGPRGKALAVSDIGALYNVYKYLDQAAKHPSPSYYQLVASLLVREHRSDEAVAVMFKAVALDPSDPLNYVGLAEALNFNGRPNEARDYLVAANRVDPGGNDHRHYLAGLAEFGQGRFEEAVDYLERIDLQSPDPWPKFYGLQVLVSAYAHLGRSDQVAAYSDRLRNVMLERKDGGANQLVTQRYFVFKNPTDIGRLLDGLDKAGLPELPEEVDLDAKDRLTGSEIRSLILGRDLRGGGAWIDKGTSWVQQNFLCDAIPKVQTTCGAIFRNPAGTPERRNEYTAVFRFDRFEFSTVK
ncbi:guanylate cyclase [Mesorhizobium sp. M0340]|uniref:adenylate/guanylate cyclase domain-containing protein n=1 Tax=Mesorhizobium sp. M0340 TaxID=2956939 RepID=UPI00333CD672